MRPVLPKPQRCAIYTRKSTEHNRDYRVRDRLIGERTALLNQVRAVLLERGITIAQGRRKLEQGLAVIVEGQEVRLSQRVRVLLEDMRAEWRELDRRIEAFDDEFAALAKTDDVTRRLVSIPGIGVLNATALVAAIGNGTTFARGRDLAAWLGLVPRQVTTGGKPRLLGISKRGNKYLRKLLVHGQGGLAITIGEPDANRAMAERPDGTRAQEQGRRCAGQQTGPDRVGQRSD
jgi:transposase